MEYKYLLELLRQGLYAEFFMTFKEILVPFLKPDQYGRSTLENSSFVVSSSHEDKNLHGQGFVARLSGSTAEFLHVWLWMNIGQQPFRWHPEQGLLLEFKPVLPGWLFSKKTETRPYLDQNQQWQDLTLPANTYAFVFLGKILVVYHNPARRDTFGSRKVSPWKIALHYAGAKTTKVITSDTIASPRAEDVRVGKVERIDIYLQSGAIDSCLLPRPYPYLIKHLFIKRIARLAPRWLRLPAGRCRSNIGKASLRNTRRIAGDVPSLIVRTWGNLSWKGMPRLPDCPELSRNRSRTCRFNRAVTA